MDRRYRIGVLSANRFLFQKIKLGLYHIADTYMSDGTNDGFDLLIYDDESGITIPDGIRTIKLSKSSEFCDLAVPFSIESLIKLIEDNSAPLFIKLAKESRRAYLGDMEIKLTEAEFALLEVLVKRGEFVKREELLNLVWGDNADAGVVTVYIHYLREKLEKNGEKIIISSRKNGYKISEKFIGK